MANNLVDHIGNNVNVWHKTGNALENRTLLTADEFGVTVTTMDNKPTFIHWSQINYIDLIQSENKEEPKTIQQALMNIRTVDQRIEKVLNRKIKQGESIAQSANDLCDKIEQQEDKWRELKRVLSVYERNYPDVSWRATTILSMMKEVEEKGENK